MGKNDVRCYLCDNKSAFKFRIDVRSIYRCTSCDFQFAHPQPSEKQLAKAYNDLYFSVSDSVYFTSDFVLSQLIEHYILPQIESSDFKHKSGGKKRVILDFGCGSGKLVKLMRKQAIEACGIEPNMDSNETEFIWNSIDDLKTSLGENTVIDGIILNEVIEHLRDPLETLKGLYSNLAEGGFIFIGTPNLKSLRALICGRYYSEYRNPTHLYFFDENTLHALVLASTGANARRLKSNIDFGPSSFIRKAIRTMLQNFSVDGSLRMVVKKDSPTLG